MKNIVCLCVFILLFSNTMLFAQDVNMSTENLSKFLCKKWKLSYIINDGMKLSPPPGQEFNYEFKNDNTFSFTVRGEDEKGVWTYDANKKLIKLKINNISNTDIISLKEGELTTLTDMKAATPDDPTGIKMIFVPLN